MKLIGIFLLAFLLVSSASALTIQSTSENNVVIPEINHPAIFTLTVTGAQAGGYNAYTLTDVVIKPTSPFTLQSGTNEIEVFIYPTDDMTQRGHYTFSYNLGEHVDKLTVKVAELKDVIKIESEAVDPASGEIKFYVENKEKTTFTNLQATFSSLLFETKETFDLGPFERKEFTPDVDAKELKKTKAGAYIITAEFKTHQGKKLIEGPLYLGEKKGITTHEDKSGFLIRTNTISKINAGNVDQDVRVSLNKNIFTRMLTSFNVEPTYVERRGFTVEYAWSEKISPAEIFTVKAKTNYIFPILIIIFAVLIVLGFRRYTETKVEIQKSVSHVKTKGGEFALKVKLAIKAKKNIENVSLIDSVPPMVKIYKKFGTAKPDSIDPKSRRIQWNIGDLNTGEVRIFSYVIYSKIGVVGKFSLPEATAVFERFEEIHETRSNKVFFLSEQTSHD
jgi:hypothetical protein